MHICPFALCPGACMRVLVSCSCVCACFCASVYVVLCMCACLHVRVRVLVHWVVYARLHVFLCTCSHVLVFSCVCVRNVNQCMCAPLGIWIHHQLLGQPQGLYMQTPSRPRSSALHKICSSVPMDSFTYLAHLSVAFLAQSVKVQPM